MGESGRDRRIHPAAQRADDPLFTDLLPDLQQKATFIRQTLAGLREGHVHDVIITKEAPNYRTDWE